VYRFLIIIFAVTQGSGMAVAEAAAGASHDLTVIDARQLAELAHQFPDLVVIDARVTEDRGQGYIEDSVSLPNVDTDCENLARLVPARGQPMAFYCNGVRCGRSLDAVQRARQCGYTRLYWFRGGFEEWLAQGYPFVKE
jgi:rhodanese-related sulfurtransferase